MAHAGARVILTSRRVEAGQKVAQELQTSGVKVSLSVLQTLISWHPAPQTAATVHPVHGTRISRICCAIFLKMPHSSSLCSAGHASYWIENHKLNFVCSQGPIEVVQLDLADLSSVHGLANQLNSEPSLDFLFLNAGVMACPQSYTKNGFEMQVGTNHFGHFELTSLLMDKLRQQVSLISPTLSMQHHLHLSQCS